MSFEVLLKELQNYNRKVFLCPPQKLAWTQPTSWTTIFHDKFTLHMKPIIYIRKTSLLLVNNIHLFFPSLEIQRRITQTTSTILQVLLLCLKRNDSQNFKSSNCKKHFRSVTSCCYCYKLLRLFFILCDDWRHFFYKSLLITWGLFNHHVLPLFETSGLKEDHILFFYLHNKSTMLIPKRKVAKWTSRIPHLLNFLYLNSSHKVRKTLQSTWQIRLIKTFVYNSITIASSSKLNRQKIRNTETQKTRFLRD